MAAEVQEPSIKPDYRKAVQEVYSSTTGFIVEQLQALDVICTAPGCRNLTALPSWTPDFTISTTQIANPPKGQSNIITRYLYAASKNMALSVEFSADNKCMVSDGIRADVVNLVAPYWHPDLSTADFWDQTTSHD